MTINERSLGKIKAWPFEEARRLLKRINSKTPEKGYVLFETGYGPSGLPHIGTFEKYNAQLWFAKLFNKYQTSRQN